MNSPLRDAVGGEYDIDERFGDLDAALSAAPFDGAVICTPAHLHIAMARRLVDSGAHVLIEKPLSTSPDGIDALRSAAAAASRTVSVAYVSRLHPSLNAMKAAIDSGRFGAPVQVVYHGGQHFPTYRPAYREIYYTKHETGGGAIQDAITHVMNTSEWLVGPIDRLVADADHKVLEGVDVEDTVHILTRHRNGVMGSFTLNQHQSPNEGTLTVVCERGVARFEAHRARWRWHTEPESPWRDEPAGDTPRDALFVSQAHAFLDAIEGKGEPSCSLDDGEQTLRVNLAALASWRSRAWEEV
jgi:predicted dehydrogenase